MPSTDTKRKTRAALPPLALLGALLFALPHGARAATFTVSSNGDDLNDPTTLRGAIAASEASTDASDTIAITATGTIPLTPANGPLAVYNGQTVTGKTLTITGPGAGDLAVDGGGQTGVFSILDNGNGSIAVAISGLTVQGGANADAGAGIYDTQALTLSGVVLSGNTTTNSSGGGLFIDHATVTLTNCTLSGNTATPGNSGGGTGGGLYAFGGDVTLTNCTVSGNTAEYAGGLENDMGTLTLTGSDVNGNTATYNAAGLENDGTATLTDSTIRNNTAAYDMGGLYNAAAMTLTRCTVSDNSASDSGGGLYNEGALIAQNDTFLGNTAAYGAGVQTEMGNTADGDILSACFIGCTFSGNSASQEGGGLSLLSYDTSADGGVLSTSLTNCTVMGNSAAGDLGGGLYVQSMDATYNGTAMIDTALTNCTVSGNTAPMDGGGLDFYGSTLGGGSGPTCTVTSSLIAGNILTGGSPGADPDCNIDGDFPFTSGGSNLIGISTTPDGFVSGTDNDQVGTTAAPIDPLLDVLADNGGPVQTLALLAGSPAIDADFNAAVSIDARGLARPSGAQNDIGAFEVQNAGGSQGPTAAPDAYTTTAGVALTVTAPGVLANDTAPNAVSGPTAVLATGPAHGALTLNADGSFAYTPAAGFAGTDTFTYRADDGNALSAPAGVTITVGDVTPPTTTAVLDPAQPNGNNGYFKTPVSVRLTATDDASGVAHTFYSVNGGAAQAYTGPFTLTADGVYAVAYHSVDVAGNAESAQALTVKIDSTAPTLTFGTPSPAPNRNGYNNTPVSVPFTTTDNLSGGVSPASGPLQIAQEGANETVSVTVTDAAGNSRAYTTPAVSIDLTKPVTTAATQSTATGEQITLSATDNLSGVAGTVYAIDGGAQTPYTGAFTVTGNGPHAVTYFSTDKADNVESTETTAFTINIAAPITTASVSGPQGASGVYTGPVSVTLTARSATSTVTGTFYRIDGGEQRTYSGPFPVSGDGAHTVLFHSTDAAGNVESDNTLTLTIQTPPPAPAVAHTFGAGLQMFSVPADYSAVPLGTALSQSNPRLAVWDPASLQYGFADSLRPGQGYWARFSQATSLYDLGTPTPTDKPFAIALQKGWNMIGDPFPGAVNLASVQVQGAGQTGTGLSAAAKAGLVYATLYSYPAGASDYQTTGADGSLTPYVGYWIYAFQPCALAVAAP